MTPSRNPRLAVRRFSSARSIFDLAIVSFLLASVTRKVFWFTWSSIISRASARSRVAMLVAPLEARTLYITSPQFQRGTLTRTPTFHRPLNLRSKLFTMLGLVTTYPPVIATIGRFPALSTLVSCLVSRIPLSSIFSSGRFSTAISTLRVGVTSSTTIFSVFSSARVTSSLIGSPMV